MLLLRTLAPWLLLACFAQRLSVAAGARQKGRQGKAPAEPGRAQGGGDAAAAAAAGKGRFSTDSTRCAWSARQDGDAVKLRIGCQSLEARDTAGAADFRCEYAAVPAGCPGYRSDPGRYWKQVARALKKMQRKLCRDERALIKTGMCKRAPAAAHFKLITGTASATAAPTAARESVRPTPGSSCTEHVDQRQLAQEYCGSSWASLCSFFFAMVQSGDC
ncbi:fibroblast growth factor-binding protein 1-like [Lampris incognitus]|uniref:fibroblast growth factor-binding protein 1-like n=1 Tax=Lampris incognitus TaxID=2546036 RepID=UPI0024B4F44B|nr:fibroblast growth factor-binding protein 1-like [Lampris incognitus]